MNSRFDLTGKVAIVTGATTELGVKAAKAYAQAGADLALVSEDALGLFQLKSEIERMGCHAIAVQCTLTSEASVKVAIGTILDKFGRIDILFNNSAMALRDGREEMLESDWGKAFGEVFTGIYLAGKYVIPAMKRTGGGRIVNISSASSRIPAFNSRWSNSPVDTVADLTNVLARHYASYGVMINTVAPEKVMDSTLGFEGTVLSLSTEEAGDIYGRFVGAGIVSVA